MSKNPDEVMKEVIAVLMLKGSYWGFLFSRIKRRSDNKIPYCMGVASDPDSTVVLYYNPDFISEEDFKTLESLVEHEGMHLLNDHISRMYRLLDSEYDKEKKKFVAETFNLAADCAVNSVINIPRVITLKKEEHELIFPERFQLPDKQSAEFYFFEIMKQSKKVSAKKEIISISDCIKNHEKWTDAKVSDPVSFSRKVETFIQDIAKEAFNECQSRGTVPSYISQMIQQLLEPPKLPYYQIIRKLVRSSRIGKFKSSSTRINRKRTYVFVTNQKNVPEISPFPGRVRDYTFKIGVLIDTSGSMSVDKIRQALSGVRNLIENDRNCITIVIEIDVVVQKEYRVKRIDDIEFNVKGRGGTELFPALKRFKELKTDVVLGFTDGWCENINVIDRKLLPKKIIWVVLNGSDENVNKTGFVINLRG